MADIEKEDDENSSDTADGKIDIDCRRLACGVVGGILGETNSTIARRRAKQKHHPR